MEKEKFKFDYFYGAQAEQYAFFRIPMLLIKDDYFNKNLSDAAKLLYGLMLDRLSLSVKNNWFDEENRVFIIYTIEQIMIDLNCGRDKAIKIMAELDEDKGIGLIKRIRQGFGKPAIIYVYNFMSKINENIRENAESTMGDTEVGKTDFTRSEKPTS